MRALDKPDRGQYTSAYRPGLYLRHTKGGDGHVTWETPAYVEIKMDAEINSYQEDDREDF